MLARRAWRNLTHALEVAPSRFVFVLFCTWFNGWCTARRFQVKQAPCLFGCDMGSSEDCLDSIQHYAYCPIVASFASRHLCLPHAHVRNLLSFLCLRSNSDDELFVLQLLLLYAVYAATNCLRFQKPHITQASMHEFLLQFVHQGAAQSAFAQRVVHKLVTTRGFGSQRTRLH